MILSRDEIKTFANINDAELDILEQIKEIIKLRPSGKLQIQGTQAQLDELSTRLIEIITGLQYQFSYEKLDLEKIKAAYFVNKMSIFKKEEIFFKFLNESTPESAKFQTQTLKVDRLEAYIQGLDKLTWVIKSKNSNLSVAHSTDY